VIFNPVAVGLGIDPFLVIMAALYVIASLVFEASF